jgi:hypothetical protein
MGCVTLWLRARWVVLGVDVVRSITGAVVANEGTVDQIVTSLETSLRERSIL